MWKQRLISTITLLILDAIWIKYYMGEKYKQQVRSIQGTTITIRVKHAIVAYIFMIIGLNVFVLTDYNVNIIKSAIFGLVLYGVYDFTNLAIFDDFDFKLALTDTLWGSLVYALAAATTHLF